MTACPDCGAQDQAEDARFCGRCGALLGPSTSASATPAPSRRRWPFALVALVVTAALVAVGVRTWRDRPTPSAWERAGAVTLPTAGDVVAAGPDHVLVGGNVLATAPDATPARLQRLPGRLAGSALDEDRWALFEGGALVIGSLRDGVLDRVRARTSAAVGGTALAWVEGDPVLPGEDGHLARLGPVGEVVWWTEEPVTAVGAAGGTWLLGEDASGDGVAIDTRDGAVQSLAGRPLAVLGDVAVVRRDDVVVGVDLPAGTVRWQRTDGNGVWRVVAGELVLEAATSVARVDPTTGATTDEVAGPGGVAVAGGAVLQRDATLEGVDRAGAVRWTRALAGDREHRLVALDAARVAVRSRDDAGTTVTVLATADGAELATATVPPAPLFPANAADGLAGLLLPGRAGPLVVDITTGAVVDGPTPPLRRDRIDTPEGTQVLADGLVSVRAAGPLGVWRALLDAPLATAPVLRAASVDLVTTDGAVQRLAPSTGDVRWRTDVGALPTAIDVAGDAVHVGTDDGRVVVLDEDGTVVRTLDVGGPVTALAAGTDGLVVVTADGSIRGYER